MNQIKDSDSVSQGSNPCPPANQIKALREILGLFLCLHFSRTEVFQNI